MVDVNFEPELGDFYYELAEVAASDFSNGQRYFVRYNGDRGRRNPRDASHISYMHSSTRVWQERNGKVVYMKNRFEDRETAEVDMKEFMWIKLKAQEI